MKSSPPTGHRARAGALTAAAAAAALVLTGAVAPQADAAAPGRADLPSAVPNWPTGPFAPIDTGAAPAGWSLSLRVYLGGQDPVGLAEAARQVSDPASRDYAHYLTPAQFVRRYGTTPAQTAKVSAWLSGFGMHVTGSNAHYLAVSATVAEAQQAFATTMHGYTWEAGTPTSVVAPVGGMSVPAALGHDISTVVGMMSVSPSTPAAAKAALSGTAAPGTATATAAAPTPAPATPAAPPCSQWWGQSSSPIPAVDGTTSAIDAVCGYTPQQLRSAYGVTDSPYTGKGRTVAVVLNSRLPTMEADADKFFAAHGVPGFAPGQYSENLGPDFAASCQHTQPNLPEEPLDVESVHIAAPDAKVVYVGADCTQDSGLGGGALPFLDAQTRIVDQHLADVSTDSFSTQESDNTPDLTAAWDQMFQQGALEGIGFNFDSGDSGDGVSGFFSRNPSPGVLFPASDPWATGVGGTTLEIGKNGNVTGELGWGFDQTLLKPDGTGYQTPPPGEFMEGSSGGRSDQFAQPWYQRGVVPSALATASGTGPARRAVPDIAADGDAASGWLIGWTGPGGDNWVEVKEAGTSGSAPLLAGLEADAAQAAGHALGFANPLLYRLRSTPAIHDVLPAPAGTSQWVVSTQPDWPTPDNLLLLLDHDGTLKTTPGFDDVTGIGAPTANFVRAFARH